MYVRTPPERYFSADYLPNKTKLISIITKFRNYCFGILVPADAISIFTINFAEYYSLRTVAYITWIQLYWKLCTCVCLAQQWYRWKKEEVAIWSESQNERVCAVLCAQCKRGYHKPIMTRRNEWKPNRNATTGISFCSIWRTCSILSTLCVVVVLYQNWHARREFNFSFVLCVLLQI